jgi:hypothetical protein
MRAFKEKQAKLEAAEGGDKTDKVVGKKRPASAKPEKTAAKGKAAEPAAKKGKASAQKEAPAKQKKGGQ